METENINTSLIYATTKTSSWPIVRGSIDHAVTCESSISAVDSDSDHDHTVGLERKSSFVLRRSSFDSDPCEITIKYAQQHEIKQVYVRSTARVYEIYYASDEKCENEYLCTVRCGLATRDEELLKVTDAIGSLSTSSSVSDRCVDEGNSRTESGSSTNVDGWVDVEVPDSSAIDPVDCSLPKEYEGFANEGNQVLFEAAAEISDVDPVLSITLRLLSIQSGDYIYMDEVYVFSDPVVSSYTDSSAKTLENSSGNALMSILVPTLLQLSKSRMNHMQDRYDSAEGDRTKHQIPENKSIATPTTATNASEGVQSTMLNEASIHMSKPEVPLQTLDSKRSPYSTSGEICCNHMERSLYELVSRVAKIEHFCLRFEENLLKPISSMEARLVNIEQQLESFVNNPQFATTACIRISAPELSYNESESNSIYTDGNDYPLTTKSESINKDDCHLEELPIPPLDVSSSDIPSSTTVPQLLPSLVVTAPDFSNVDDEEETDTAKEVKDSANDIPKKPLSIENALASALAGFLSSASTDLLECTDKVEEAADFPSVEGSKNTSLPALIQSDEPLLPSLRINEGNETAGTSCKDLVVTEQESPAAAYNCYEETVEAVDKQDHNFEADGGWKPADSFVDNETSSTSCKDLFVTEQESLSADNCCEDIIEAVDKHDHNFEAVVEAEGSRKPVDPFVDNVINLDKDETQDCDLIAEADDEPNHFSDTPTLVGFAPSNKSVAILEVPGACIESREDPDIPQNILKLPIPAAVDFKIPILDVKFLSLENSSAKAPLEALLCDVPEPQSEVPCVKENDESSFIEQNDLVMINSFNEQNDLVMIENEASATSETYDNYFWSANCHPDYVSSNTEEAVLQDLDKCSNKDMCASLI